MGLLELIKQVAMNAITNAQLCNIMLGTVTAINPIVIETDQKLALSMGFLLFTSSVSTSNLKEGTRVIMIREAGGQQYFVMDYVREADD